LYYPGRFIKKELGKVSGSSPSKKKVARKGETEEDEDDEDDDEDDDDDDDETEKKEKQNGGQSKAQTPCAKRSRKTDESKSDLDEDSQSDSEEYDESGNFKPSWKKDTLIYAIRVENQDRALLLFRKIVSSEKIPELTYQEALAKGDKAFPSKLLEKKTLTGSQLKSEWPLLHNHLFSAFSPQPFWSLFESEISGFKEVLARKDWDDNNIATEYMLKLLSPDIVPSEEKTSNGDVWWDTVPDWVREIVWSEQKQGYSVEKKSGFTISFKPQLKYAVNPKREEHGIFSNSLDNMLHHTLEALLIHANVAPPSNFGEVSLKILEDFQLGNSMEQFSKIGPFIEQVVSSASYCKSTIKTVTRDDAKLYSYENLISAGEQNLGLTNEKKGYTMYLLCANVLVPNPNQKDPVKFTALCISSKQKKKKSKQKPEMEIFDPLDEKVAWRKIPDDRQKDSMFLKGFVAATFQL
jgi:hypothetical protein